MKSLPSVRWVFVLHPRMLTSTFGALAKILCASIVRWIIKYIGWEHTGEIYLRQSAETMGTNSRKAFKGLFVHGCSVWQFLQTWRFEGSSTSCSEGKGGARDNSVYRLGTERDSSSSRLLVWPAFMNGLRPGLHEPGWWPNSKGWLDASEKASRKGDRSL